jgi:hypothetical protein
MKMNMNPTRLLAREQALAMDTPEVRDLNRIADYAPTNLAPAPSDAS